LQQAERVAAARHDAGAGSYLDLLAARRSLLEVQGASIDTAADGLAATIEVYRALGGGWAPN
jgi:multidrug efflux system outer membrane protein